MRAPHGNNLLSAGQGLSTKLLQDLAPRVSAFLLDDPLIVVNGTKDPVDRLAPNTSGKRAGSVLGFIIWIIPALTVRRASGIERVFLPEYIDFKKPIQPTAAVGGYYYG
jgi:hypothetical protein